MRKKMKNNTTTIDEFNTTPSRLLRNCLENFNSGSYLIYRFGREFLSLSEDEKIEFILLLNQTEDIKNRYLSSLTALIMANDVEFYEKYKVIIN